MNDLIVLRWNGDDSTCKVYKEVTDMSQINDDLLNAQLIDMPGELTEPQAEEETVYACPECEAEVNDEMDVCDRCGQPLEWEAPKLNAAADSVVAKLVEKAEPEVSSIVDTP